MQGLEGLSERIESARQLKTVVSSMKSMASLSIRHYEQSVHSLREYNRTLEQGLCILLQESLEPVSFASAQENSRAGFLVLGSSLGMCGPFNDKILDYALRTIGNLEPDGQQRDLYSVGERMTGQLENEGRTPTETLSLPSSVQAITPVVQDLLHLIDRIRTQRGIRRFWIFHNRLSGERNYEPHHFQLLPINPDWLGRFRDMEWSGRTLPRYRGNWKELVRHLMDQHFFVSLFRAYAESLASENAARLQAMGGAEDNIRKRLKELKEQYNQSRQTQITEELLDLTSGYEALSSDPQNRKESEEH